MLSSKSLHRAMLGVFFVASAALAACGGGGGGSSALPVGGGGGSTPVPIPAATTVAVGTSGTASGTIMAGTTTDTFQAPAATAATTVSITGSATNPTSVALSIGRQGAAFVHTRTALRPMTIATPTPVPLAFLTLTVSTTTSFSTYPSFTIVLPSSISTVGQTFSIAFYTTDPAFNLGGKWLEPAFGPITASGQTLTFTGTAASPAFTLSSGQTYYFCLYEQAAPTPTPSPPPTPTPGVTATPASTPTPVPSSAATLAPISSAPNGSGWAPYAVANAFQYPVQSGYNGTGQTIAVLGDYPPSAVDLSHYLTQFGITQTGTYTIRNVDGGSPKTDSGGLGEATLDVETVSALAPGANIVFYAVPDLSNQSFLDAYNAIIADNTAKVASISFGGCEGSTDLSVNDPVFAQGAAAGIAWVASAGDQGDECYVGPGFTIGVNTPAADPNVVAVGGTETDSTIASTTAWNDGNCGSQCATGGGVSTIFSLPSYQSGLAGEASTTHRNVPDVAMPAVFDGVYQSRWNSVLGTSWSAPETAAMIAEIYQYCKTSIANPVTMFYTAFSRGHYADFTDVTSGTNRFGSDATYYNAGLGFDNVSGIGVPLGMPIANSLCPNRVPTFVTRSFAAAAQSASYAPAVATSLRTVPDLRGTQDLGERSGSARTRVALVLRATSSLASDERTVVDALTAAGFTVTGRYNNHLVIDAEAPASVVDGYFQTRLHDVAQGQYGTRYANTSPVVLPASVAPYVQGVIAHNLIRMIPLSYRP